MLANQLALVKAKVALSAQKMLVYRFKK